MLRSLIALERYEVSATDGDIGTVQDFLLDDEHWVVRYLEQQGPGLPPSPLLRTDLAFNGSARGLS